MEAVEVKVQYEKYPAYKDSGVEWLGEIPEGWELVKGKWLFKKEERPIRKIDGVITCFRDGQVTLRSNRRTDGFTNALKEHGYQGVRKGDLVIHAMDAFAGAIGVSDSDGKSTPVYSVCTPKKENFVNQYYYAYFLRNMAHNNVILALAKGIRERSTDFRYNDFGELNIVLPPLKEQTAIANYLDDKTSKIDHLISQKEKMISLLEERKQIIIQELVTGKKVWNEEINEWLGPTCVKDSGVEWIREIPEGWKVKRLKYVAKINSKSLPDNTQSSFMFHYVDIGSVSYEKGIEKTEFYEFKNSPSRARRIADVGDTIVSTVRTYLKAIDFITENKSNYVYSTGFAILKPFGIHENYLFHIIRSNTFTDQVSFNSKGMSYPAINSTDLGNLFIIIPPLKEQLYIVNQIESESTKINNAISLNRTQIERLKEYKSILIDNAVTGKIKVI